MKRKEVLQATIFILIFLIVLTGISYCVRTNGTIKDIFTGFYAEDRNTIDVIMIGSSPVYPFYSAPQIYGESGISAYPLSSHVQRPSAALPLIKEAEKYQNPLLYVFEMRMYTMEDGQMIVNMNSSRSVVDNMRYSMNRIYAINRMIPSMKQQKELMGQGVNESVKDNELEERYTYYFDIFKYHSNWRSLTQPDQLMSIIYARSNPSKGFEYNEDVTGIADTDRLCSLEDIASITGSKEELPLPVEQEARLNELLDYLDSNNINALFIVSPYNVTPDQMKMYNYMSRIITEHGYTFDNMNDKYDTLGIDFTTDYYDDGGHTNNAGAVKCTNYLISLLEDYNLPDHRGDNRYQSWDEAYRSYLEHVGNPLY